MTLLFVRGFFLLITAFVGFFVGSSLFHPFIGVGIGIIAGVLLIVLEMSLQRVSVRGLSSMVFGLLLGLFMATLISNTLSLLPLGEFVQSVSRVILTIVFSYLGAVMALRGKDEFHVIIPYVRFKRQDVDERIIILDTSAIIDGRILDIYKTNFFGGRLVVPRFVLLELQRMADAEDEIKRQRGRRGLDFLRNMQKNTAIDFRIHEDDIPGDLEVDTKLVRLAKILDACVCTLDYNLGRAAAIQGVTILNINELVNAVRPQLFPGDELEVRLVKEGKELNQAVAFTDEGTMIVVADGRALIGKKVKVRISSLLQTQGGRMIFSRMI